MCQFSGAFSDHCRPCSIVNKDEHDQGVAHLLCNCDLNGSDAKSGGYSLDLGALRMPCQCTSAHVRLGMD